MLFSSSIEVLRMQRENQHLRKTIEELKHSSQRIIELEAENEQLQKTAMEGKNTVYNLTEVRGRLSVLKSASNFAFSWVARIQFCQPMTDQSKVNPRQTRITFDALLKTAVFLIIKWTFLVFCSRFAQDVAKLKAKGLQQDSDLNKLRAIVKKQNEELQTSADNVLNLSGELREKGEEIAQIEEQSLL